MAKRKPITRNKTTKRRSLATKQRSSANKQQSPTKVTTESLALRTPLSHGSAISAQELELEVGRVFTVERFAALCNAIAWGIGGSKSGLAQLSFTERVNVADNGIDAEWTSDFPDSTQDTLIAGSGWNVFQFKKRDITAQGRQRTLAALVNNLKGALKDVARREGKQPDRYVLFTNVHFTKGDKERLVKSIRTSYKGRKCKVVVLGAAELSTLVNDLTHLRSAYFSTSDFATWSYAWSMHKRQKLFGASVALTGRNETIEELKSAVDDADLQVILVSGANQIGKSRLVFEATKHRQLETVVNVDPLSISTNDLFGLQGNNAEALVIVEDVEPDVATQLANAALGQSKIKLVLTVPTSDPALSVNFGLDPRMKHMPIGGISEQEASALLRVAGAKFDYSVESWVVQQAGGNPGILLSAARITDLRSKAESFTDQIAQSFERRIKSNYGDQGLKAVRVVSVLSHVGFRDAKAHEIKVVSDFLGAKLGEVVDSAKDLLAAGILKMQGSFLEVTPVLLGNYEALAAIRGTAAELHKLLQQLDDEAQRRLVRRLRALQGSEISAFWDDFFGKNKPFGDFGSALEHAELIRSISAAVPDRVVQLIHTGLSKLAPKARSELKGDRRRELMWTLEELLFRRHTSESALKSVSLLAESENESISNNATGIFRECFNPMHPQFPLSLERRLTVLREALSTTRSDQMNVLAVNAIETAFDLHGVFALRRVRELLHWIQGQT